jgi:hypothetical protein
MNHVQKASAFSALRYAFTTYMEHWLFLLIVSLLTTTVAFRWMNMIHRYFNPESYFTNSILLIITLGFILMLLGEIQIILDLYFTEQSSLERFIAPLKQMPAFVGAFIILSAIAYFFLWLFSHAEWYMISFFQSFTNDPLLVLALLKAVLIILFLNKIIFVPFLIVDMKVGALKAIKLSYYNTKGYLLTISFLLLFFSLVTAICGIYLIEPVGEFILYYYPSPTVIPWLIYISVILLHPCCLLSLVYLYGHQEKQRILEEKVHFEMAHTSA